MSSLVVTVEASAAVATVGSVALGMLMWFGRKAWKAFKRFTLFLDDYEGTPARSGVDARPGVMERLKTQDELLAQVIEQQTGTAAQVKVIFEELPKNGVPVGKKIHLMWMRHLAAEAAEAAAVAAPAGPTVVIHNDNSGSAS